MNPIQACLVLSFCSLLLAAAPRPAHADELQEKKEMIRVLVASYQPRARQLYGKEIELTFDRSEMVQLAGGPRLTFPPRVLVFQGALDALTEAELLFGICHELGHSFGEITFRHLPELAESFRGDPRSALEGEADYFAGACTRDYLRANPDLKLWNEAPKTAHPDCREEEPECSFALDLAKRTLETLMKKKIDPSLADGQRFDGIHPSYPSSECRVRSSWNGTLGRDRPRCWYDPK